MSNGSIKNHLTVPASQAVSLIQHYLIENGLTSSSAALQAETTIGSKGLLQHAHTRLKSLIVQGDWGNALEVLSGITLDHSDNNGINERKGAAAICKQLQLEKMLAQVHEMAILELADAAEMDLAFATLKISRELLDNGSDENPTEKNESYVTNNGVLSASVERKLHAINAMRSIRAAAAASASASTSESNQMLVPPDYYGPKGATKEKRRIEIAKKLGEIIPIVPPSRLMSLCQQAIKWQIHTGEIPMIKELCDDGKGEIEVDGENTNKKKRKKSKSKKRFDLVMGEVTVENATRDILNTSIAKRIKSNSSSIFERIPLDPYSTLKFGKKTTVTSCTFFTDSNTSTTSLITGTSDGYIEIWDSESKFTKLRMDLKYQKNDEIMCHAGNDDDDDDDTPLPSILAMAVNADGTMLASGDSIGSIFVWNIETGSCLCELEKVHGGAITCLDFSPDGTRILSGSQDGTCREFGLRTKRILKEFRGHTSFINSCHYNLSLKNSNQELLVVTSSADSTVRVWCGRSAEEKYVLNPMSSSGSSAILKANSTPSCGESNAESERNIHTILPLHTPANTMIVIPRGPKAYHVTTSGLILKVFENDRGINTSGDMNAKTATGDFVVGEVSGSNKWLYLVTDSGICLCFDVSSGAIEQTIDDFGEETSGKPGIEVSGLVHHPLKGILAAFSSSKAQKRGLLTIWK